MAEPIYLVLILHTKWKDLRTYLWRSKRDNEMSFDGPYDIGRSFLECSHLDYSYAMDRSSPDYPYGTGRSSPDEPLAVEDLCLTIHMNQSDLLKIVRRQ